MTKGQSLQDSFLNAPRRERVSVSIYLVSDIKLQGQIKSFDQFVILLKNTVSQVVYKYAISTVIPSRPVPHHSNNAGGGTSSNYHHNSSAQNTFAQQDSEETEQGFGLFFYMGSQRSCAPRRSIQRVIRLFDRYDAGGRVVPVHICFTQDKDMEDLQEFESLVSSAGVKALQVITGSRKASHPKYFVGEGKAVKIVGATKATGTSVVLFDHALNPTQEYNLERSCGCRVIDRTGPILDILAQRARTREGKLQVKLARLRHLATCLVRGWTHLERQRGRIGSCGPGETQLEADRRLLRNRIIQIQSHPERVEKQREQGRQLCTKADVPTVSLMGYINASKPTLFNRITETRVYAADQLLAILDPTLQRIDVADVDETVLADAVGFVHRLPYDLVATFRATLQKTRQATLLLYVIDAADVRVQENIGAVSAVLEEIDAHEISTLLVVNKIDMLGDFESRIDGDEENKPTRVWFSMRTGVGIPQPSQALTERLSGGVMQYTLRLPPQEGRLGSYFYRLQAIEKEWMGEDGSISLQVRMPVVDWHHLCKQEPALIDYLI